MIRIAPIRVPTIMTNRWNSVEHDLTSCAQAREYKIQLIFDLSIRSLGPSVSSRASRFDATVADKYRSEARDLISKYTSKERPSG